MVKIERSFPAPASLAEETEIDRTMALVRDVFNLRNTGMRTYTSDIRFKKLQNIVLGRVVWKEERF